MPNNFNKARGLAKVQAKLLSEQNAVGLILTDTSGKAAAFAINPEGLNTLLEVVLGLAVQWADKGDLKGESLEGSRHALPAQRISIGRGQHAKECAVKIYLGKIELAFLLPLDDVISAAARLPGLLEPPDSGTFH